MTKTFHSDGTDMFIKINTYFLEMNKRIWLSYRLLQVIYCVVLFERIVLRNAHNSLQILRMIREMHQSDWEKLVQGQAANTGSSGIWTRDLSHPKRESYPIDHEPWRLWVEWFAMLDRITYRVRLGCLFWWLYRWRLNGATWWHEHGVTEVPFGTNKNNTSK